MRAITKDEIISGLKTLGVKNGDVVMVHTSFKNIGYVCGGAHPYIWQMRELNIRQSIRA